MRKLHFLAIFTSSLMLLTHLGYADEDLIYLTCKADPGYVGKPEIIINKTQKTINIVPIEESLPLLEDTTNFEGKLLIDEKVMFHIRINKFTLNYVIKSPMGKALGGDDFDMGKCAIEAKKL